MISRNIMNYGRQFGTFLGLILLCLVLWILTPYFLTVSNLLNILEQSSINAIIAVGMTFVIITAGIDLSVGSILAFSGVVLATVLRTGIPLPVALLAGLVTGTLCGLVNGMLVSFGRLPPFIVTLGMMSIARGAALVFTNGRPVSGFEQSFRWMATGKFIFIPMPLVIMIIIYVISHLLLTRTIYLRHRWQ
jgi:ribose transport system permease protein